VPDVNPNDREQIRERMRELGRASGRARRERKKAAVQPPEPIDVLEAEVKSDLRGFMRRLVSTGAGAVKAAALLEDAGRLVPEPKPEAQPDYGAGGGGKAWLLELVAFAYESGNAAAYGLPATPDELAERLREGQSTPDPRPADAQSPVPARGGLTRADAAVQDPPKPPEGPTVDRSSARTAPKPPKPKNPHQRDYAAELEQAGRVRRQRQELGLPVGSEHRADDPGYFVYGAPYVPPSYVSSDNPPQVDTDEWL
jgi:hypothetical protein